GGPEAWILGCVGNLIAEFRGEFAMHGRAMHANLLEYAPAHQRRRAATAGMSRMIGALPWCAHETSGRFVGDRRVRRQRVLHRLESSANVVAQRLEPGARASLVLLESFGGCHRGRSLANSRPPRLPQRLAG